LLEVHLGIAVAVMFGQIFRFSIVNVDLFNFNSFTNSLNAAKSLKYIMCTVPVQILGLATLFNGSEHGKSTIFGTRFIWGQFGQPYFVPNLISSQLTLLLVFSTKFSVLNQILLLRVLLSQIKHCTKCSMSQI
jgi:hypothetical protein